MRDGAAPARTSGDAGAPGASSTSAGDSRLRGQALRLTGSPEADPRLRLLTRSVEAKLHEALCARLGDDVASAIEGFRPCARCGGGRDGGPCVRTRAKLPSARAEKHTGEGWPRRRERRVGPSKP